MRVPVSFIIDFYYPTDIDFYYLDLFPVPEKKLLEISDRIFLLTCAPMQCAMCIRNCIFF